MDSSPEDQKHKSWGHYYLGLFDGSVADAWFRWAEWLLVTAALYAAGRVSGSLMLKVFAYISAGLAMFYAMNRIEELNNSLFPRVRKFRPLARILAIVVIVPATLIAALALSNAINALFSDSLVQP